MGWMRTCAADLPEVVRYMQRDLGGALFPLANLAQHGFEGPHPYAMDFWQNRDVTGAMAGVLGMTRNGMVLPVFSDPGHAGDLSALHQFLRGRTLVGGAGRPAALRPLLGVLSLSDQSCDLNEDETAYLLELDRLSVPATEGLRLRPIRNDDCDLLISWRAAARVESLNTPVSEADAAARRDIAQFLGADTHRLLLKGKQPVAMTGFNARFDDVVQIGGVYTPPELRARGFARAAVALHLLEARDQGVHRAMLFTHSAPARRAYMALGFAPNGDFALVLFSSPQPVRVP